MLQINIFTHLMVKIWFNSFQTANPKVRPAITDINLALAPIYIPPPFVNHGQQQMPSEEGICCAQKTVTYPT